MATSLLLFLYLAITIFIVIIIIIIYAFFLCRSPLCPMLKEEAIHLNIYNAMSKEKRDFKTLVTTAKLRKYDFYPGIAALPKNCGKKKIIFDWTLGSTGRTQHPPLGKAASAYPVLCLFYAYL